MTIYQKDEIRVGMYLEKDCPIVVERATPVTPLSDIQRRLESVKKKLAILRQFVGTRQ
jgi:hypothetical protein